MECNVQNFVDLMEIWNQQASTSDGHYIVQTVLFECLETLGIDILKLWENLPSVNGMRQPT